MDVVYARGNASVLLPNGGQYPVVGGQHWPANDPVVLAQPSLFSTDPRFGIAFSVPPKELSEPPVESTTAAPGEKRATRRG